MAEVDLSSLNLEELNSLRKDIDKAIQTYETRQKQEAMATIEAKAKEMGFSLSDLVGGKATGFGKRKVNPPKYRHPENPEATWTGRGRQPAWIKEALENGKSLDEFLIVKS